MSQTIEEKSPKAIMSSIIQRVAMEPELSKDILLEEARFRKIRNESHIRFRKTSNQFNSSY
ncbi:MAG: hypothetical protein HON94_15230 [Methylococcales bacterium]|jgi:hypothetical protein|nr:hypothetical protein [Methylococcales bacterium]MBT7408514.1 hypothetical protein [Methylococcales bacterium]